MGQARVDNEGIKRRQAVIEAWEKQISLWQATAEDTPGMRRLREATLLGIQQIKKEIDDRNKTLSFATEPDRLDLAKLNGKVDGLESVYYDIAEAPKKIEQAKLVVAKLVEEIKRAKKGELIETRA